MSLKDKMEKFNKRWSIVSSDTYEEAFKKFKIRILNIFKDIDQHVRKESISEFCQYYGITENWHTVPYRERTWSNNILNRLNEEDNEKEFYRLIEVVFSLDIIPIRTWSPGGSVSEYGRDILFSKVKKSIDFSSVNVSITKSSNDDIILYPRGEKKLDQELVNSPLSFLEGKSEEHFIQALGDYQLSKHVKSAESLRRSLEEFLRYKLKNKKGLAANITEIQREMKSKESNPQIRNIIGKIFTYLDTYFNENSKHNDGDIDDIENEFLIYQTGLLMRYVDRVGS